MIQWTLVFENFRTYEEGEGGQKFPEFKKKLFKIFVQILNFTPLQGTPPVTGYSDPSAVPTAGNTV